MVCSKEAFLRLKKMEACEPCNRYVIFVVESINTPYSYAIHFEYSNDNCETWCSLWIRSLWGAQPQEYVMMPGIYFTDVQHATHIRYRYDLRHRSGVQVRVKFVDNVLPQNLACRPTEGMSYPWPPRANVKLVSTGGREVSCITAEGIVYAFGGRHIYRSEDYGTSWKSISNPFVAGNVTRLVKLSNDQLLVIGNNLDSQGGLQAWKSDQQENQFCKVEVFSAASDVNTFWGLDTYDEVIVYAPYVAQPRHAAHVVEAYLSRDYGSSWEAIFRGPETDGWHLHGIRFDPFDDRIWLLNGDGSKYCNVWYSDDWGQTWETLWTEGAAPVQFTDLIALSNCLIFGLDDNKGRGFFRLDKPINRGNTGNLHRHIHEAFFVDKVGAPVDATGRFLYHDGVAYLPYESPRGVLTVTRDGYNYFVIWDYTQELEEGVEGLLYLNVTRDGKLVGYFKDANRRGNPFLWIAEKPIWINDVTM